MHTSLRAAGPLFAFVLGCSAATDPSLFDESGADDNTVEAAQGGSGGADTGPATGGGGSTSTTIAVGSGSPCSASSVQPVTDCASAGIVLAPEFAGDYTCIDLGTLPTIPVAWGGFAMKHDDPSSLLITGTARDPGGRLHEVPIGRDPDCHVAGFTGTSTDIAEAPYNEAGVAYGPNDVLFLAQAIVNRLGLLAPGSQVADKVIDLGPFGVDTTICGVGFVPSGFEGEGLLKLIDWPEPGFWYSATYADDGAGTVDVLTVTRGPELPGGAAGFVFVAAGNAGFPKNAVLVSEFGTGAVTAYEQDGTGDPDPATGKTFLTGLSGVQGGVLDPVSGDFLFSTYASARIIAVRGFAPPPPGPK